MASLKLTSDQQALLRCPRCTAPLRWTDDAAFCTGQGCVARFPVADGVPILLDEAKSIFDIADFLARRETTFRSSDRILKDTFGRVMPRIGHNIKAAGNYARFAELLAARATSAYRARVLVVGGSILGKGMEPLAAHPALELVETDLAHGPRTMMICDGHDLPFVDASFDGVIVQAVLEHVLDPVRCVAEIHRVLRPEGVVYGETPFMQQVHMGPYDFTRFTHLGHRRLFRHFEEIESGASCGPGMALAWAWQYFLLSFTARRLPRALLRGIAALTAFPLKYLDYFLIDTPGSLDAASGVYFLGRKSDAVLSDRALVKGYRGAM
ncbi:MAG: methyltransferase domain-containing protein [Gemmatimonadota bacterium]|nr:methyltransferase domain-containing protein [Gemmatimonadota bacterium]